MKKSDIKKMRQQATNITSSDRVLFDGSPVLVDIYVDQEFYNAYQLDEQGGYFRTANLKDELRQFGEWTKLDSE